MSKCTACGFEYTKGDKTAEIRKLLFERREAGEKRGTTRILLMKAGKKIMKYVPSDNKSYKFYAFLCGVKNIENEPVNWATIIYLKRLEYKAGKGFPYLRAMIQNADKDYKVKKAAELRLLGKTPKSIKDKRKELGYASRNNLSSK